MTFNQSTTNTNTNTTASPQAQYRLPGVKPFNTRNVLGFDTQRALLRSQPLASSVNESEGSQTESPVHAAGLNALNFGGTKTKKYLLGLKQWFKLSMKKVKMALKLGPMRPVRSQYVELNTESSLEQRWSLDHDHDTGVYDIDDTTIGLAI